MTEHVVVVGYGNVLRCDDGVGWHAAERLVDDPRMDGVEVLQRHQLTPELALDISAASLVVVIDASSRLGPGEVRVDRVEPAVDDGPSGSHRLTPATLVALSHALYGRAADVFAVSCGVQSLEVGEHLSPVVDAALPRLVDAVTGLVESRARLRPCPKSEQGAETSDGPPGMRAARSEPNT